MLRCLQAVGCTEGNRSAFVKTMKFLSQPRIAVVGSLNVDYTLRVKRLPLPGETLTATGAYTEYGGKGANQAVACARAGGAVSLVGCLGEDAPGAGYLAHLRGEGIETRWIKRTATPTGSAYITVADSGENQIVVYPGANWDLRSEDIETAREVIQGCDAILLQLEVPWETVRCAAMLAREGGVPIFMNPSPLRDDFFDLQIPVDVLIVNENEASRLLGRESGLTVEMGQALQKNVGCESLVITRGGASTWAFRTNEAPLNMHPPRVRARDTVGAGDAFTGALALRLAEGVSLGEAVRFANTAGALAAMVLGAQPSIPTRDQIHRGALQERGGQGPGVIP